MELSKIKLKRIFNNRIEYYNENGYLHREDGPAIEYNDGRKLYYINGKRHRTDGPACEYINNRCWFINGKKHREDGPAVEYNDGQKLWFLNNKYYSTEKEWFNGLIKIKLKRLVEYSENL
jgi:hypothetical protein